MAACSAGHALFLPYPAQGHVIPFMELAHRFLDRGFDVTFVNTEFNHRRVMAAAAADDGSLEGEVGMRLVAVADGMGEGEDRENLIVLNAAMEEAVPPQLEALLDDDGGGEAGQGKVTCVVVDVGMSWVLGAVKRRGLLSAVLWPASAAVLSVLVAADALIRDGVIDDDGAPLCLEENNSFRLAESAPAMDATFLAWNYMVGNRDGERLVFHYLTSVARTAAAKADFLLCNTFAGIEPAIFSSTTAPASATIVPIGPLCTWRRTARHSPVGHFWRAADEVCLSFLEAQPRGSVVYVAFGSLAVMTAQQLQELAFGLEASERPFLWVVRPELVDKLPAGFTDGATAAGKSRGRVVGWAPQAQVLGHPAVGCFLTHCGWNSTLEGVRNGVPMLCWPYFTDQFANQTYICDVWKVGMRVAPVAGEGMVTKERIMEMLSELWGDEGVKERVRRLKEMAEKSMSEEGESIKNIDFLCESMRR